MWLVVDVAEDEQVAEVRRLGLRMAGWPFWVRFGLRMA